MECVEAQKEAKTDFVGNVEEMVWWKEMMKEKEKNGVMKVMKHFL